MQNIQTLPKILVVGEGKDRYHVVHSFLLKNEDLQPDHPSFVRQCCLSAKEIDAIARGEAPLVNPRLLTDSRLVGSYLKTLDAAGEAPPDLSTTEPPAFCGHTPLRSPVKFLNHFHLDTGAGNPDKPGHARKLTAIDVKSGEIVQVRASQPELKIEPKDYVRAIGKALAAGEAIPELRPMPAGIPPEPIQAQRKQQKGRNR